MTAVVAKLDAAEPAEIPALMQTVGHDAGLQGRRRRRARSTARSSCRSGRRRATERASSPEGWAPASTPAVAGVQIARQGGARRQDDGRRSPARRRGARAAALAEGLAFGPALGRAADAAERGHAERHDPAGRAQGPRELSRRAQRGPPGPGRDVERYSCCDCAAGCAGVTAERKEEIEVATVRRRDRPGHHQHPLHGLRPRRAGRLDRPEGARADLSQARLGRARPDGDLGAHAGGHRRGAATSAGICQGRPRGRRASPTSARPRWCGTAPPASRSTTRSSGRTPAPTRSATSCGRTAARTASGPRPACRWRPTSPARRCAGSSTTSTGARDRAEAGELLFGNMDTWVHLEPDRRRRTAALHVTDVTNASRTMLMDLETLDWDDEIAGRDRRPAGDAARRSTPPARSTARSASGALDGRPGRRRPRRPAGGAVRPDLLRAGRGQEHLRHRLLPAAQHRHRGGRSPRTAC